MAKHTAGPWEVSGTFRAKNKLIITQASGELNVAHIQWDEGKQELSEKDEANASLIAAAPEMLDCLNDILRDGADWLSDECSARLRAVIAKAEGK